MIIGISGGSGSGKTTFSNSLAKALSRKNCVLISQDSYYLDNSHIPIEERKNINFDHPSAIDFELLFEQLTALKNGQDVMLPVYSFLSCTRSNEKVKIEARPIIIIEGIFIFQHKPVRDLLDIKIFLEASADERLKRISARDEAERGRTYEQVCERFYNMVEPMHRKFVDTQRIFADVDLEHTNTKACVEEVLWFLNEENSNYRYT